MPDLKIKTHGSVSCGPRKQGVRVQHEYISMKNKVQFYVHLYLCGLLTKQNQICCAGVSILGENTYQIWSKSCQPFLKYKPSKSHLFSSFFLFLLFFFLHTYKKTAIKCTRIIGLPSNLAHIKRDKKCILVPSLVQNWQSYKQLFTKIDTNMLSHLQSKLLIISSWKLASG